LLAQVTDPTGAIYTYGYPAGYLSQVNFPDGRGNLTYHFEAGAGQLTGISIAWVRYTHYTYSSAGQVLQSKKDNGADLKKYAYFPDRVERTNALGRTTTYTLQNGRITDITGKTTTYCPATFSAKSFDAEGRLDILVDENGNATNYDYDTNGRLTQVVEAAGTTSVKTTQNVWDATTGRIAKITVVGVRETSYTYNAQRRVTSIAVKNLMNGVLNQVRTTTYTYTTHPSGLLASTVVDGPLPGTSDAMTYVYNATGDLTSLANGLGHTTSFSNYNALGWVGRITDPNGAIVDYLYDVRGRIATVKPTVNGVAQATTYAYDTAGRLASVKMPDGQLQSYLYDSAGRLISTSEQEASATTLVETRQTYNAASLPTEIVKQRITP
jgi:YD repeat-containing protein